MFEWKILDTGIASPETNMEIDAQLLEMIEEPTLHLYDWDRPCATYGHFIKPGEHINVQEAENQGISLAKRPTGGGIIFHLTDYAFSALVPASHPSYSSNTLESYAYINHLVGRTIQTFLGEEVDYQLLQNEEGRSHFCMAKPTKYDVMLNGFKVGGAAQRRTKKGFLHQGTVSLVSPSGQLQNIVSDEILFAMQKTTCCISDSMSLLKARDCFKKALIDVTLSQRFR